MSEEEEPKPLKVFAKGNDSHGREETDVEVINPGDWFGQTHLIGASAGYSVLWFAVESGSGCDAEDEFAEHDRTRHIVEITGDDLKDYSFEVNPGDMIGGTDVTEKGWMDYAGNFYKEDPHQSDARVSGQGIIYDSDNIVWGSGDQGWDCEYYLGVSADPTAPLYEQNTYSGLTLTPENFSNYDGATYSMFSDLGNEYVDFGVRAVLEYDTFDTARDQLLEFLNWLHQQEGYEEATDTMVRDCACHALEQIYEDEEPDEHAEEDPEPPQDDSGEPRARYRQYRFSRVQRRLDEHSAD